MILIIECLMIISTIMCFLTGAYFLKLGHELYQIGEDNRFIMSFAFIAFAYAIIKNTIPMNDQMAVQAILLQEVFRILVPLIYVVVAIKWSKFINKTHTIKYNGIDRRQTES